MNNLKISLLLILVSTTFLGTSCKTLLTEATFINKNSQKKILIAGVASEFKDTLRTKLIERYKGKCSIEVVNLDKLADVNGNEFQAIIIMDEIQGWGRFNPEMKELIDNTEDKNRIVLFISAGDPDYEYSYGGIDAITSASDPEKEEELLKILSEKIDKLL